jgi:hypothetical protein
MTANLKHQIRLHQLPSRRIICRLSIGLPSGPHFKLGTERSIEFLHRCLLQSKINLGIDMEIISCGEDARVSEDNACRLLASGLGARLVFIYRIE